MIAGQEHDQSKIDVRQGAIAIADGELQHGRRPPIRQANGHERVVVGERRFDELGRRAEVAHEMQSRQAAIGAQAGGDRVRRVRVHEPREQAVIHQRLECRVALQRAEQAQHIGVGPDRRGSKRERTQRAVAGDQLRKRRDALSRHHL